MKYCFANWCASVKTLKSFLFLQNLVSWNFVQIYILAVKLMFLNLFGIFYDNLAFEKAFCAHSFVMENSFVLCFNRETIPQNCEKLVNWFSAVLFEMFIVELFFVKHDMNRLILNRLHLLLYFMMLFIILMASRYVSGFLTPPKLS